LLLYALQYCRNWNNNYNFGSRTLSVVCAGGSRTKEGNELDVVVNILSLAGKGANKTEIMRRCSLKSAVLEKYLFALTELNLLKVEEKSETYYRTSDKGLQLLHTYYRLKWLLWGDSFDFLLVRLLGRLSRRSEHKSSCGYIS